QEISPFVVSFVPMAISAGLLLAGSAVLEDTTAVQFTPAALFSIIFLAVFGTVVTFVSYFWLLKRVEVVLLSLTSFVTPLIAILLGVIILGEHVSPQLFGGASLVFLGIASAHLTELRALVQRYLPGGR
ncbi:MAG: EamA family transporter, partial [Bacteroidetes bacterium]|nr:EamA family transporter [Bacteroidota bacterium]